MPIMSGAFGLTNDSSQLPVALAAVSGDERSEADANGVETTVARSDSGRYSTPGPAALPESLVIAGGVALALAVAFLAQRIAQSQGTAMRWATILGCIVGMASCVYMFDKWATKQQAEKLPPDVPHFLDSGSWDWGDQPPIKENKEVAGSGLYPLKQDLDLFSKEDRRRINDLADDLEAVDERVRELEYGRNRLNELTNSANEMRRSVKTLDERMNRLDNLPRTYVTETPSDRRRRPSEPKSVVVGRADNSQEAASVRRRYIGPLQKPAIAGNCRCQPAYASHYGMNVASVRAPLTTQPLYQSTFSYPVTTMPTYYYPSRVEYRVVIPSSHAPLVTTPAHTTATWWTY